MKRFLPVKSLGRTVRRATNTLRLIPTYGPKQKPEAARFADDYNVEPVNGEEQKGKRMQVELRSEMKATLIDSMGGDESVVHAARVSIVGAAAETEEGERKGLLGFLMSNSHASPFEHTVATFMVECPIFVTREVHRHRTFSYNEVSGRYSVLKPLFYAPDYERPMTQVGKPGQYSFEQGTDEQVLMVWSENRFAYQTCWDAYERMLDAGIAKEVARDILPVGCYTAFYMTGNLRNWLNFLKLRTAPDALYEIRQLAGQVETQLQKIAPTVLSLWNDNGRGQL